MGGSERGSITPLVALLAVAVGGLCLALGQMGGVANARAQAQAAADAAALAAAAEGAEAAAPLARANGAEVERVEVDGDEVTVVVRLGEVEAVARATGERRGPTARVLGMVPELRAALAEAGGLLGRDVPVTSGWRSRAEQQRLYDDRGTNPYPVAVPGTSAHERGRAVDVPRWFVARLVSVSARVGLCHPWPDTDPVHFELCRRTP